jgi:DNA-binding MarR family transcriptional regulator
MTTVASADSGAQGDLPGVTVPELATMLRPLLLRVTRNMRSQRVDSSITLAELSALHTVTKDGPMTTSDLAGREGVRPPTTTKVIAKLEHLGLLARRAHATDKRQWLLVATEAGKTLVEAENRSRTAWLSQRLSDLTPDERMLLLLAVPVLTKIADV